MVNGMVARKIILHRVSKEHRGCNECGETYQPTSNRQKICVGCRDNKKLKVIQCGKCGIEFKQTNGKNYACKPCMVDIEREQRKQCSAVRWKRIANERESYQCGYKPRFCMECFSIFYPKSPIGEYCKFCAKSLKRESDRKRKAEKKIYYAVAQSKWAQANRSNLRAWRKTRYTKNAHVRLAAAGRSVMRYAFKQQGLPKPSFRSLIGISEAGFLEYLLNHPNSIENGFTAENYGSSWHVDHIRPLASFQLADETQRSTAFHYTNCQPMAPSDNMKKTSKWNGVIYRHQLTQT